MRKLPSALQFNEGRSKPWSGASVINAYAEAAEGDKQDVFALIGCPGWIPFATIGGGRVRGQHVMDDVLYAVIGEALYSVSSLGTFVSLGAIPGSDIVQMADNGTEVAIAAAGIGYVMSGTLQTPVPYGVSGVVYIDGYFIWPIAGTDQFIISGLNDGLSYDLTDVATVEGAPDDLTGVEVSQREVLFPGVDTIEIWWDSGASDFPFQRQGNAFVERGCPYPRSLIKIDNSVQWFADDGIVYRLNGYQPERISTHSIEYQLRGVTDAWAFSYTQEGHKFYVLQTDRGTFAFDMATRLWHRRQSYDETSWNITGAINVWGKVIAGNNDGNLVELSLDVNSEGDQPLIVGVELPTITGDRDLLTLYAFEAYVETGVGDEEGSQPQIMLQFSRNSGRSWSSELWRSLGAIGDFARRAVWRVGVKFRQLTIRLRIADPARRIMISYWADIR